MSQIAIHSRRTITPKGVQDAIVVIEDGVIVEVTTGKGKDFEYLIDVENDVLMPGIIDPHVHINEPGRTAWEGFNSATKAALAGGVTTLVDMPLNSSPVTTNSQAFYQKIKAAENKLHANCGFWGGIIPGNINDIEPLILAGVLGFKAFLIDSGIDEYPAVNEEDLRKAMPVIAKHGLPLLVHCELNVRHEEKLTLRSQRSQQSDAHHDPNAYEQRSYKRYLDTRPRKWENDAIEMMIALCEKYQCRTHIVHLSSSDALKQIVKARKKGLPLSVETGQHYLFFQAEEIKDGQTELKCAPPIREKENNEKLWQALKDGTIDFVATDHSPAPADMKELKSGDFMKAWGGIASLQFSLPALWTTAREHGCSIEDIAKWLCEKPAEFLRHTTLKKGRIEKGYDADLVVWSPEKDFIVKKQMIRHKHKITPYVDRTLYGVVKKTFLAGELVYSNGTFVKLKKGKLIVR